MTQMKEVKLSRAEHIGLLRLKEGKFFGFAQNKLEKVVFLGLVDAVPQPDDRYHECRYELSEEGEKFLEAHREIPTAKMSETDAMVLYRTLGDTEDDYDCLSPFSSHKGKLDNLIALRWVQETDSKYLVTSEGFSAFKLTMIGEAYMKKRERIDRIKELRLKFDETKAGKQPAGWKRLDALADYLEKHDEARAAKALRLEARKEETTEKYEAVLRPLIGERSRIIMRDDLTIKAVELFVGEDDGNRYADAMVAASTRYDNGKYAADEWGLSVSLSINLGSKNVIERAADEIKVLETAAKVCLWMRENVPLDRETLQPYGYF